MVGFTIVAVAVLFHNRLIFGDPDWQRWLRAATVLVGYSVLAWLVLALGYRRLPRLDLVFLVLDIAPLTYAIYATGGERSWLFFILVMRTADQTYASVRRSLFFAHATVAGYAALLLWLVLVEHRPVDSAAAMAKLLFIYGANLYVSLTAIANDRRRRQLAASVRMARDLIGRLEEKSGQLEEARERAEAASQAKTQFLATMSHELRTPLNAIIGFSAVLAKGTYGALSEVQLQFIASILAGGRHLLHLVDDILDFAKVDAGQAELHCAPVEPGPLVRAVAADVEPLAHQKSITITVDTGQGPAPVVADAGKLRQMVYNLLANAIKFTPDGGQVTVTTSSDGEVLRIAVHDSGIGIKLEDQRRVFETFEQVDSSYSRTQHGTGLGLALTRRLAELHGGRVLLESSGIAGEGCTFTIELPIAGPQRAIA